jgi:hypothetical protein
VVCVSHNGKWEALEIGVDPDYKNEELLRGVKGQFLASGKTHVRPVTALRLKVRFIAK